MARRQSSQDRLMARLMALNDERSLILEELSDHRDLFDDASTDAAVFDSPIDREAASLTSADVARLERLLAKNEKQRTRLLRRLERAE